ncbi:amidophosphoribosyltransferase [Clostridium tetani]|uniref:amidophosphoribosyltransferase n=1 Tax=Clostridium tetani TaxID=1513 RepID=UPI00051440B9|nr:amidophosphoribosyltransferase [Clostridium tetani]KGI44804.1 amidophosphoribosyltransferase [Clostridium tetani]RXI73872.1 amidophosphoribosyltransferase [Clostridium tetani]BDR76183.1 amidophosphoribosyltransferase [Clostridium tetani]BDR87301.1 amidophosphoribosyltransferase [Clostridium tetani]
MEWNNLKEDKFKDECGVFGIFTGEEREIGVINYYGLFALQHRGQDSAGMVVSNREKFIFHKDIGLVEDVFSYDKLNKFKGICGIGHVKYSSCKNGDLDNVQPVLGKSKLGSIAIAHNGSLVNAKIVKELLEEAGIIFQTNVESEVVLNLIARSNKKELEDALMEALQSIKGSYAMLLMTQDKLIGLRDPKGIRPLCIGKLDDNYVISSESCAINAIGGEFIRDVEPGEMVVVDKDGLKSLRFAERTKGSICAFEYIYFARPDSFIDNISVYEYRVNSGEQLYKECPVDADIIVGVPDSGIPAAIGYSKASGIPYGIGFIKNKYIGRSFIEPTQEMRERAVLVKLNPLKYNVEGKRVVIIDDSIVRGTTSKKLISSIRRAGAKEVHFMSASPMVKFPCYLGIDTPNKEDLMASNYNIDEIKEMIGADSVGYLSIEGLTRALGCENCKKEFCLGCFSGEYPVSIPKE